MSVYTTPGNAPETVYTCTCTRALGTPQRARPVLKSYFTSSESFSRFVANTFLSPNPMYTYTLYTSAVVR